MFLVFFFFSLLVFSFLCFMMAVATLSSFFFSLGMILRAAHAALIYLKDTNNQIRLMYIDIFFHTNIWAAREYVRVMCPFFSQMAMWWRHGGFLYYGSFSLFRLPKCNYIYVRFPSRIPRRYISRRVNTLLACLVCFCCSPPFLVPACLYLRWTAPKKSKNTIEGSGRLQSARWIGGQQHRHWKRDLKSVS